MVRAESRWRLLGGLKKVRNERVFPLSFPWTNSGSDKKPFGVYSREEISLQEIKLRIARHGG